MRRARAMAVALVLLPAGAATQVGDAQPEVYLSIRRDQPLPPGIVRPVMPVEATRPWVRARDYPPDAVAAHRAGTVELRRTVAPDDRIAACRVTGGTADAALRATGCPLAMQRAGLRHALADDGTPATAEIDMVLVYALPGPSLPPAPPPAPPRYPVMRAYGGLEMTAAPDWSAGAPEGWGGDAEVEVEMMLFEFGGTRQVRRCSVLKGSGTAALDAATCRLVEGAQYRIAPGGNIRYLPMIVRWKQRRATVTYPKAAAGKPLAFDESQLLATGLAPDPAATRAAVAETIFGIDGSITCQITLSSGGDARDAETCARLRRVRFTPARDVFGRPVPTVRRLSLVAPG